MCDTMESKGLAALLRARQLSERHTGTPRSSPISRGHLRDTQRVSASSRRSAALKWRSLIMVLADLSAPFPVRLMRSTKHPCNLE